MINRTSAVRRQHSAALADAGPDMHDHAVGARVMTCDGHPGTVTAVNTGPYPGTESYAVTLDGGMGGGDYDGGQIWAMPAARTAGTAAADYPELAQILIERPDPARHTAARSRPFPECGECQEPMAHGATCAACGDHEEHHTGCCPSDTCDTCGERPRHDPRDCEESCDHCEGSLHSRPGSYDYNSPQDSCDGCGERGHHSECCHAQCSCGMKLTHSMLGFSRHPSRCEGCNDDLPGHHPECCPDTPATSYLYGGYHRMCRDCARQAVRDGHGRSIEPDHTTEAGEACEDCGHILQATRFHNAGGADGDPGGHIPAAPGHGGIGERGYEPDNAPIENSIGAPCPHCHTPLSADAAHYGCVLCGGKDHHSYCCPSPDGRTAARRISGRVCDSCADRTPGAAMTDCPFCGTTHHNRASCCPLNCADCGARLSAHTGACAHCGYGDHHSECCTMACSSCEGPLRDGGKATCGGCDTERAGHHPGCCPIQKPMGYRDGDEDLCPSCAHATGAIDHPLYRDADTYCDHCAAPMSLPRRRYTTAGITEVMASAEMSLGETIVPSMSHLPGPTRPRSPFDNPASTGWATGPDPDQWSAAPLYPLDSRVGMRGPEACDICGAHIFNSERRKNCSHCGLAASDFGGHHTECCPEIQPCDHCDQPLGEQAYACGVCGDRDPGHHAECCPHRGGGGGGDDDGDWDDDPDPGGVHAPAPQRSELGLAASRHQGDLEATLHEEPEAALPTTDGTVNADDADPEALNPMEFNAFLADFQKRATHLHGAGPGADGDVASAAAAFLAGAPATGGLSKAAMRDFTPAEQRMLIEEAPGARAGNADRLDLTGTHYADMAAMVGGDEEDDSTWLM